MSSAEQSHERVCLGELRPGDTARIHSIEDTADRAIRLRLLEMGLVPGTPIRLERRAPLGDPLEISIRGYALTLRKSEAALIRTEANLD